MPSPESASALIPQALCPMGWEPNWEGFLAHTQHGGESPEGLSHCSFWASWPEGSDSTHRGLLLSQWPGN